VTFAVEQAPAQSSSGRCHGNAENGAAMAGVKYIPDYRRGRRGKLGKLRLRPNDLPGAKMAKFVSVAPALAAVALVGGYAWTCPATATADPNSTALAGMLSKGYSTSNCHLGDLDQDDRSKGILAGYDCGQNSLSGGPTKAAYVLFDNSSDTSSGFQELSGDLTNRQVPCASDDPDTWHYDSSPNTTAGKVFCGAGSKGSGVIWTNDQNHMVGAVFGSDISSLYRWWLTNG
jgi:hypothetical protein